MRNGLWSATNIFAQNQIWLSMGLLLRVSKKPLITLSPSKSRTRILSDDWLDALNALYTFKKRFVVFVCNTRVYSVVPFNIPKSGKFFVGLYFGRGKFSSPAKRIVTFPRRSFPQFTRPVCLWLCTLFWIAKRVSQTNSLVEHLILFCRRSYSSA